MELSLQECTTFSIAAKMLQGICSYDARQEELGLGICSRYVKGFFWAAGVWNEKWNNVSEASIN